MEVFNLNLPSTTVTTGGTTAPAQGTVELWVVASGASFPTSPNNVSVAPKGVFHVVEDSSVNQSEVVTVQTVGVGALTSALTSGVPVTSIATQPLSQAINNVQQFVLIDPDGDFVTVSATANASVGATSVSVSFTPAANFGIGTIIRPSNFVTTTPSYWHVVRGAESTTPITHAAGFTIVQTVTAGVFAAFLTGDENASITGNWTITGTMTFSTGPSGLTAASIGAGTFPAGTYVFTDALQNSNKGIPIADFGTYNTTGTSVNSAGPVTTSYGGAFPSIPRIYITQSALPGGSGVLVGKYTNSTTTGFDGYSYTGGGAVSTWTSTPFVWTAQQVSS